MDHRQSTCPFCEYSLLQDEVTFTPRQVASLLSHTVGYVTTEDPPSPKPQQDPQPPEDYAVSDKPWGDFSESDYTPEQWRKACLIHLDAEQGQDPNTKSLHKLPVYEPGGDLNRNGCHAAASVLAGGRGGVDAPADKKKAAAKTLVGLYRNQLKEDPPQSLLDLAGMRGDSQQLASLTYTTAETATSSSAAPYEVTLPVDPTQVLDDGTIPWAGVLTQEGLLTGDGRMIEHSALSWDTLPLPLRWVEEDESVGHAGARVVGYINTVERQPNGTIWGTGTFDLHHHHGREAARQVGEGLTPGVSVDLDDVDFEIRVAPEVLAEQEAIQAGNPGGSSPETDSEGRVVVLKMASDDEIMVTTAARIRAATIVAIPAFEGARITLTCDDWRDRLQRASYTDNMGADSLTAAAAPVAPPRAWFEDPHLPELTPIKVTEDGRIYGHIAPWNSCHTSFPGRCVPPPHSTTGYSYFLTGALLTAEGDEIPVGRITMDTGHADLRLSMARALAHYDNTGLTVADVVIGEDVHGPWIAGACRPEVTAAQMRRLRAAPPSGDWRRIRHDQLELVAVLSVNSPGYLVPRTKGLVASGVLTTLVASLAPADGDLEVEGFTAEELTALRALAAERHAQDEEARAEAAALLPEVAKAQADIFAEQVLTPGQ